MRMMMRRLMSDHIHLTNPLPLAVNTSNCTDVGCGDSRVGKQLTITRSTDFDPVLLNFRVTNQKLCTAHGNYPRI